MWILPVLVNDHGDVLIIGEADNCGKEYCEGRRF